MVRANNPIVPILSDEEQVIKYTDEDAAALSPGSKDSLWSNAAVSGSNMKRSKKLQSVLIRMTGGSGGGGGVADEERHDQSREMRVYVGKNNHHLHHQQQQQQQQQREVASRHENDVQRQTAREDNTSRIMAAFDAYESREDNGHGQSTLSGEDMTVGREQEEVRAAIRRRFFNNTPGGRATPATTPRASNIKAKTATTTTAAKKVFTSPSTQRVLSPRSRTRVSPTHQQVENGRNSVSPSRGRRRRNSYSPRRKSTKSTSVDTPRKYDSSTAAALERPSTPKRMGRNASPNSRKNHSHAPDDDDDSTRDDVRFMTERYHQRKGQTAHSNSTSSNRSDMWDSDSLEESTDKTSSSDYDSSTTGSFSVDRMRSMRRKIQKANQKKSLSPRRGVSRPLPEDEEEDNGGILPLLDIAGAATDFVSQLVDQILPMEPGTEQPRRPYHHNDNDLPRSGYDDSDDYNHSQRKRRPGPKRRKAPLSAARSPSNRSPFEEHFVDTKKISEIVKAALNSQHHDTDASGDTATKDQDDDGGSLTYSLDDTVSTNVSKSVNKQKSQTEAKSSVDGKVNGLVAKFEKDSQQEEIVRTVPNESAKHQLLADFDEEKATPRNLALALSMSGDDSLASGEGSERFGAEEDSLLRHIAKSKKVDDNNHAPKTKDKKEESRKHNSPMKHMLGRPVFPPAHKHELEAKIKESFERRMAKTMAKETPNRLVTRNTNTRPVIPPDAPVASKRVAVNYINAIAKYFQPHSEHATDYVKAIQKGNGRNTTEESHAKTTALKEEPTVPKTETPLQQSAPTTARPEVVGSKTEMDELVSKIDGVVQRLIKSGKLLAGNDSQGDDIQKRNTAELLKNLAILRSRRAGMSVPKEIKPRELQQSHIIAPSAISSDSGPEEVSMNEIKSNGKSNLDRIRAKRDEAAMRIRQQTQKLTVMKSSQQKASLLASILLPSPEAHSVHVPWSSQSVSGDSTSSFAGTARSSRSHGGPPRPEDRSSPYPVTSRDDTSTISARERNTFAHLSSTRSVDDSFAPPARVQFATPPTTRRSRSVPRPPASSRSSDSIPRNDTSTHSSQSFNRHPQNRRNQILQATASDDALKDWESAELNKLPLLLNVSKTDGGSRDEFETSNNQLKSIYLPNPYHSNRRQLHQGRVYGEELTDGQRDDKTESDSSQSSYDDTFDTDSGNDDDSETDGSESDGERLARIAVMVRELKKRRRMERALKSR